MVACPWPAEMSCDGVSADTFFFSMKTGQFDMQIRSYFCFVFIQSLMVPWLGIEPPRAGQTGKPEVV